MKILITGANGFIDSRTCLYLKNKQYEVTGLVRKKSYPHSTVMKKHNL